MKDARAAAATAMQGVVKALRDAGVAERDIRTTTLSLQPVYDYNTNGSAPKIVGYELRNGVVATIRDLEKIADAVDGALAGGGTTLDGVAFRVDDPTGPPRRRPGRRRCRRRGPRPTRWPQPPASRSSASPRSASSRRRPRGRSRTRRARADEAAATPILAGTSDVTVSVSVVYLIG